MIILLFLFIIQPINWTYTFTIKHFLFVLYWNTDTSVLYHAELERYMLQCCLLCHASVHSTHEHYKTIKYCCSSSCQLCTWHITLHCSAVIRHCIFNVCEGSDGLLFLGLSDLRAALLSGFYPVITTRSSFSPHSLCYRSINHLITAMHLLASE